MATREINLHRKNQQIHLQSKPREAGLFIRTKSGQSLTQEEANQFILECHFDLDTIKGKLEEKPELIKSYNPENSESALGASGHMGREDIAEFLLSKGAEIELATAAMLGVAT